jgi:hypothetical protein
MAVSDSMLDTPTGSCGDEGPAGAAAGIHLSVAGCGCGEEGAESAETAREQARGSMRRLAVAFALAVVLAFLCFVLAPQWGVHLPMLVPLMGFGAIALGTIMAAAEAQPKAKPPQEPPERPMCCCGPRPVGEATRRSGCR